jgi:AmiR/NasT family two-component response regulator
MTAETAPPSVGAKCTAEPDRAPAGSLAPDDVDVISALSDEVNQLHFAIASNRRIGMAMGIVMGQLQIGDDEAFDALRRISQNTNRKLRDVADDVIYHRRL